MADLDEQLRRGIRALDLRPGLYNAGDSDNPKEFLVLHLFRGNVYSQRPARSGRNPT